MSERPWFKFFAADYLTDAKIDALPPEAEGIVIRIWAICHIEGCCPSDPEELSRKIRRPLSYVLKYKSYYESLFELKDHSYVSPRMEKERRRSETNRANVSKRYSGVANKSTFTVRTTSCSADFVVQPSDSDNDSGVDVDFMDGQVHEIAALYPRINDAFNLPQDIGYAIASAIARDGRDIVWVGTKAVQEVTARWPKSEIQFLPSAQKFFRESNYRNPPEFWQRSNGNGAKRQVSAVEQRVAGNRDVLSEALRTHVAKRVGSDGNELEDSDGAPAKHRVSTGSV